MNLPRGLDENIDKIEARAKMRDKKEEKEQKQKKPMALTRDFAKVAQKVQAKSKVKKKRAPSPWIRALKEWNEDKNRRDGKRHWCVPKKGSKGHKVVTALSQRYKKKKTTKKTVIRSGQQLKDFEAKRKQTQVRKARRKKKKKKD